MRQLLYLLLAFGLLVTLGLTNPSPSHHRDVVAATYKHKNPITGQLGVGHLISRLTSYHDYVFLSVSTLAGRRVSIGGLGVVYAFPPRYEEAQKLLIERIPDQLWDKMPEEVRQYAPKEFEQ